MVEKFSQNDKRWAHLTLGRTKLTMGEYGCFVVSVAMLDGRAPDLILNILNKNDCFNYKGMLLSDKAARFLGLKYKGKSKLCQEEPCIVETNHFTHIGIPQHFFVWLGGGYIHDPLDGLYKLNPYHIVNYRLFREKPKEVENGKKESKEKSKEESKEEKHETKITWVINLIILNYQRLLTFVRNIFGLK